MGQITHWVRATGVYSHKTEGIKTWWQFCQDVVKQINKNKERNAEVVKHPHNQGMIAVFSRRTEDAV